MGRQIAEKLKRYPKGKEPTGAIVGVGPSQTGVLAEVKTDPVANKLDKKYASEHLFEAGVGVVKEAATQWFAAKHPEAQKLLARGESRKVEPKVRGTTFRDRRLFMTKERELKAKKVINETLFDGLADQAVKDSARERYLRSFGSQGPASRDFGAIPLRVRAVPEQQYYITPDVTRKSASLFSRVSGKKPVYQAPKYLGTRYQENRYDPLETVVEGFVDRFGGYRKKPHAPGRVPRFNHVRGPNLMEELPQYEDLGRDVGFMGYQLRDLGNARDEERQMERSAEEEYARRIEEYHEQEARRDQEDRARYEDAQLHDRAREREARQRHEEEGRAMEEAAERRRRLLELQQLEREEREREFMARQRDEFEERKDDLPARRLIHRRDENDYQEGDGIRTVNRHVARVDRDKRKRIISGEIRAGNNNPSLRMR